MTTTNFRTMDVSDLGDNCTQADLERFRTACETFIDDTGCTEEQATEWIWNGGDSWADRAEWLETADDDERPRIIALAQHLGVDVEEIDCIRGSTFKTGREEYLVITDEEGDELWDEQLENYIDECLEIPDSVKPYFDREKWKADARNDGRGHSLAGYDGEEHSQNDFYIFRTN